MNALVMAFYAALIACCASVASLACVFAKVESLIEKNYRLMEENALLRSAIEAESDGEDVQILRQL